MERSRWHSADPYTMGQKMGNSFEHVTLKTLEATTQLCSEPVEMENMENPRKTLEENNLSTPPNQNTRADRLRHVICIGQVNTGFQIYADFLLPCC